MRREKHGKKEKKERGKTRNAIILIKESDDGRLEENQGAKSEVISW